MSLIEIKKRYPPLEWTEISALFSEYVPVRNELNVRQIYLKHNELKIDRNSLTPRQKKAFKARDKIILHNIGLVITVANNYRDRYPKHMADLYQYGMIGLTKAADIFKMTMTHKFSTYAVYVIKQQIYKGILSDLRIVRLPGNRIEEMREIAKAKERVIARNGVVTLDSLCKELCNQGYIDHNLIKERVRKLLVQRQTPLSLTTVSSTGEIYEEQISSHYNEIESSNEFLIETIESMDYLSLTQKRVFKLLYGYKDGFPMFYEDVAREIGISADEVEQIEKNTIEAFSNPLFNFMFTDKSHKKVPCLTIHAQ